jgi:hypothetical protein
MFRRTFRLSSPSFLFYFAVRLSAAALRRVLCGLARLRSVLLASACWLAVGGLLAGCSPTYDWRTVMNNDNGYTVDLPAKPSNDARQIDIGGTSMRMAMQTAEAGNAVFAVGTVILPSDDPQTQRTALDFLCTGGGRPGARPGNDAERQSWRAKGNPHDLRAVCRSWPARLPGGDHCQ